MFLSKSAYVHLHSTSLVPGTQIAQVQKSKWGQKRPPSSQSCFAKFYLSYFVLCFSPQKADRLSTSSVQSETPTCTSCVRVWSGLAVLKNRQCSQSRCAKAAGRALGYGRGGRTAPTRPAKGTGLGSPADANKGWLVQYKLQTMGSG